VYKTSQTNDKYEYSPSTAIILAEAIKLLLSVIFDIVDNRSIRATFTAILQCLKAHGIPIGILAFMYASNNQLSFQLYLWADPASISLFKSSTSFLTSVILWLCFNRNIIPLQWKAICIQVIALIIVQIDPSKNVPLLSVGTYIAISTATLITTASGILNEYQLKNVNHSLNIVNVVLYLFGVFINGAIYLTLDAPGIKKVSWFFEGYTPYVVVVVVVNSLIGIVITLVYKYADVIVKTFASACTTCVLFFINGWLFGNPTLVTAYLGSLIVFMASYIFFTDARHEEKEPLKLKPCLVEVCCMSSVQSTKDETQNPNTATTINSTR